MPKIFFIFSFVVPSQLFAVDLENHFSQMKTQICSGADFSYDRSYKEASPLNPVRAYYDKIEKDVAKFHSDNCKKSKTADDLESFAQERNTSCESSCKSNQNLIANNVDENNIILECVKLCNMHHTKSFTYLKAFAEGVKAQDEFCSKGSSAGNTGRRRER